MKALAQSGLAVALCAPLSCGRERPVVEEPSRPAAADAGADATTITQTGDRGGSVALDAAVRAPAVGDSGGRAAAESGASEQQLTQELDASIADPPEELDSDKGAVPVAATTDASLPELGRPTVPSAAPMMTATGNPQPTPTSTASTPVAPTTEWCPAFSLPQAEREYNCETCSAMRARSSGSACYVELPLRVSADWVGALQFEFSALGDSLLEAFAVASGDREFAQEFVLIEPRGEFVVDLEWQEPFFEVESDRLEPPYATPRIALESAQSYLYWVFFKTTSESSACEAFKVSFVGVAESACDDM